MFDYYLKLINKKTKFIVKLFLFIVLLFIFKISVKKVQVLIKKTEDYRNEIIRIEKYKIYCEKGGLINFKKIDIFNFSRPR